MTNEQLASKIKAGDQEMLLTLWKQVERFAYQQGRRWVGVGGLEMADLLQVAFLALPDAVKRWDEGRGAFLTFYGMSLLGGFTRATGQRTKRERNDPIHHCKSLSEPLTDSEGEPFTIEDTIPDPAAEEAMVSVEERDSSAKLQEAVNQALSRLTDREREAIRFRFWYGLTVEQTARRMGLSKSGAYQAEQSALRRLRHPAIRQIFVPWIGA